MALAWLSCCFNFFMMGFMVNTFEQEYLSGIASSGADAVAYIIAGVLYSRLSLKKMLFIGNLIAAIFGFLILSYGL